jgi:hypothetical protein
MGKGTWFVMALALGIFVTGAAAPDTAHAVELYWDANGRLVSSNGHPVRYVLGSPVRHPRRYYVGVNPTVRVYAPPPPPATTVRVAVHRAPPPANVVIDHRGPGPVDSDPDPTDDPYQTSGIVVAGAGAGGVFFLGDGITHAAVGYKLHLGLAVGPAEFALRFDLVPDAMDLTGEDGANNPSALYTAGASFNYRFLPGAVVHPVFGVGLEGMILDPHLGETGTAFAVTGRAGLELAYPLADGALALGIDLTAHHPFGATDEYATEMVDILTFGAYADYRF